MLDQLFDFEQEIIPAPVILATLALIAIFALGIAYQAIVFLAF